MLEKNIYIRTWLHAYDTCKYGDRLESKTEDSFYTLESPSPLIRIRILRKKTSIKRAI